MCGSGSLAVGSQDLLVLALRDGDVKARYLATGEPAPQERWRAATVHPVNMPSLNPIEICVKDLIRHWPEQTDQAVRHPRGVPTARDRFPALILANTTLTETIEFLRKADAFRRREADTSI
jgi:hypothetical protein